VDGPVESPSDGLVVNPSDERGELQVEETPAPRGGGPGSLGRAFADPELEVSPRLQPLLKKVRTYNPKADLRSLEQAFEVAEAAHEGQFRKFRRAVHRAPTRGPGILADLHLDTVTLQAALLP